MYAVIETGGKQYRVEVGTELEVELLDAEAGQSITLDRVLLVADGDQASVGQPLVANASVAADVVRQIRGQKVISFKYRPKARRRVTKGHRQELTLLRISDIVLDSRSAADDVRAAEEAARSERERVEEAARRQAAADAELAAKLAANAPAKPAGNPPAKPARTGRTTAAGKTTSAGEAAGTAAPKRGTGGTKPGSAGRGASPKAPADDSPRATKKPRTTRKDDA
jgi:large subunit ribosomal protein L21